MPGAIGAIVMRAIARLAGLLILASAGIVLLMDATQDFDPPPGSVRGLVAPILAMELAGSADEARTVLRDPMGWRNRRVMREQIALDWPFIGAYWALFLALAWLLSRRPRPWATGIAMVVALAASLGALADVFEDRGILL